MLRFSLLMTLLASAAIARPQGSDWAYVETDGDTSGTIQTGEFNNQFSVPQFQRGGFQPLRQGRRISGDAVFNSLAVSTTTTTPSSTTEKKLVTLRPIGNNIQEILFNNGYRETPGEREPEINNIDNFDNLDGVDPKDVWLLDDDLLVLKGGSFAEGFIDAEPIDDYQAPYREPKFPPPGFNPEGILPPGAFGTFTPGKDIRQPEAYIPEYIKNSPYHSQYGNRGGSGGNPFGARAIAGRRVANERQGGPVARRIPPPSSSAIIFPGPTAAPPASARIQNIPRHTHQQITYVKKSQPTYQRPRGYITSYDTLPRSYSTSTSTSSTSSSSSTSTSGHSFRGDTRVNFLPPTPATSRQAETLLPAYATPTQVSYDDQGNYMTFTQHDGGFSYAYKTDGQSDGR